MLLRSLRRLRMRLQLRHNAEKLSREDRRPAGRREADQMLSLSAGIGELSINGM